MKTILNVIVILAVLEPGALSDGVVKGAKVVGNKTKDGVSKTGEVMSDTWITSRVSARFVNEATLKESNINVDTNAHIVTLMGTVVTPAGRARAGVVARETEGVRRVVNNLSGVAGMFLAVPVVGILSVVYRHIVEWRGGDATHRAADVLVTSQPVDV